MSRIGKLPIKIPTTVDVTNNNSLLKVKGKNKNYMELFDNGR